MEYYYGIDLGTTNSCISVYTSKGKSKVIPLDTKGSTTMPSCVMFKNKKLIVGKEAYCKRFEKFSQNGNKTVGIACYSIKRRIGDLSASHTFIDEETGEIIGTYNPVEISSMILTGLIEKASATYPNIKGSKVTITVPASFNSEQRAQTKKAGQLAGLNVIDIINEPTSASLCYTNDKSETILVYDLGGGTFDVSLLKIDVPKVGTFNIPELGIDLTVDKSNVKEYTQFKVLASEGSPKLGGDDLDELMLEELLKQSAKELNISLNKFKKLISEEQIAENIFNIEQFKKMSGVQSVSIYFKPNKMPEHLTHLNLEIYQKASEILYERTTKYVKACINKTNLKNIKVDKIVLVGGSTKNNYIRKFLQRDFPDSQLNYAINPDEAVGAGASIQTAIKTGTLNKRFIDISPYTIGVEVDELDAFGNKRTIIKHLFKKGASLPLKSTYKFDLEKDKEYSGINVNLYQGDAIIPELNIFLGEITLSVTKGTQFIYLITEVDASGILKLSAKDDKGNISSISFGSIKTNTNINKELENIKNILILKTIKKIKQKNIAMTEELFDIIMDANKTSNLEKLNKYMENLK